MICRLCLFFLLLLSASLFAYAQDGSDMRYVKPYDLNDSYVGKFAHLDFGKRSFSLAHGTKLGETVTIEIDNNKLVFIEHREDDGYNNWFDDQYLESVDPINGLKLRLIKNKLLDVRGETIKVESYFDFYNSLGTQLQGRSFTKELSFAKSEIAEVLVYKG